MDTVTTRNGQKPDVFELGDMLDFKVKAGRGRPSMGILVEKRNTGFVLQDSKGKRSVVPISAVLGKHVTRYTERQRRLL